MEEAELQRRTETYLVRKLECASDRRQATLAWGVAAAVSVAAFWVAAGHSEPAPTLVAGRSGGVLGEMALGALLGAAAGAWLLKRSSTRGVGPPGSGQ